MNCSQCQGIEEVFSQEHANKELSRYRSKGPRKTTRMLIEAIKKEGVEGGTLLDIGGGVGAVQHALLGCGVVSATDVDASTAYLNAAKAESGRIGHADRVTFHHGNFVDMAAEIEPADIVTLDRVICCYHDMEKLVCLSAGRARRLYGLVYPRDRWWISAALTVENLISRLQRNPFRAFVHSSHAVEELVTRDGLKLRSYHRTLVWQVVIYSR